MTSNKPTLPYNVCYRKVTRFAGVDIFSWNVSWGMLVYDSKLRLYGIVERLFISDSHYSASLYVRFRSSSGRTFTSLYSPSMAHNRLFVVDSDCYLICRNGYLIYGSHCFHPFLAGAVDCVVTKIDTKHNQVFLRPLSMPNVGYWVHSSDVVCNYLIGVNKNEK